MTAVYFFQMARETRPHLFLSRGNDLFIESNIEPPLNLVRVEAVTVFLEHYGHMIIEGMARAEQAVVRAENVLEYKNRQQVMGKIQGNWPPCFAKRFVDCGAQVIVRLLLPGLENPRRRRI
jgi:hypothetical protein